MAAAAIAAAAATAAAGAQPAEHLSAGLAGQSERSAPAAIIERARAPQPGSGYGRRGDRDDATGAQLAAATTATTAATTAAATARLARDWNRGWRNDRRYDWSGWR